jgi:CubicO group peptidase (beta-lactamase class C family)
MNPFRPVRKRTTFTIIDLAPVNKFQPVYMKKYILLFLFLAFVFNAKSQRPYFPPPGIWATKDPASMGMDTARLHDAIRFAIASETKKPRDIRITQQLDYGKEPFSEAIGPLGERGDPTGLVIYKGYIVAQWGDPNAIEITNSVSKSFLSTTIGLAIEKGLIKNVNDTVANYIHSIQLYEPGTNKAPELITPFATSHNRQLTWDVMLRQTSDWEGTLWGKPEWADRPDKDSTTWRTRARVKPGSVFEYNDVRVNALALAATCVWRSPLPVVLKKYIMDPIGASDSWQWYGYNNSWIVIDGQIMQSVSGGGHWGGGMFINAYDMARFGLLTLHHGNWNGKQLIPESWIKLSRTPTTAYTGYGYMNYFLNTDRKYYPAVPADAYIHIGNGTNIIYVDPVNDLVIVSRWINSPDINEMLKRMLSALKQ